MKVVYTNPKIHSNEVKRQDQNILCSFFNDCFCGFSVGLVTTTDEVPYAGFVEMQYLAELEEYWCVKVQQIVAGGVHRHRPYDT